MAVAHAFVDSLKDLRKLGVRLSLGNFGVMAKNFGTFAPLFPPLRNPDFAPAMLSRPDASFLKSLLTQEFFFLRQGQSILTYLHAKLALFLSIH